MASPSHRFALDQIDVSLPCHEAWEDMPDAGGVGRHCATCAKQVHDLSEMSRSEVEALLTRSGQTPCVRITRSIDGRLLMREDLPSHDDARSVGRRSLFRRVAAVVASFGLGATFNIGCQRRDEPAIVMGTPVAVPTCAQAPTTKLGEAVYTDVPSTTKPTTKPTEPTTEPVLAWTMGVVSLPPSSIKGKLAPR